MIVGANVGAADGTIEGASEDTMIVGTSVGAADGTIDGVSEDTMSVGDDVGDKDVLATTEGDIVVGGAETGGNGPTICSMASSTVWQTVMRLSPTNGDTSVSSSICAFIPTQQSGMNDQTLQKHAPYTKFEISENGRSWYRPATISPRDRVAMNDVYSSSSSSKSSSTSLTYIWSTHSCHSSFPSGT